MLSPEQLWLLVRVIAYIENMLNFFSCASALHAYNITKSHSRFFSYVTDVKVIFKLFKKLRVHAEFVLTLVYINMAVIVLGHRPKWASDWDLMSLVDAQQILISGLRRWEKKDVTVLQLALNAPSALPWTLGELHDITEPSFPVHACQLSKIQISFLWSRFMSLENDLNNTFSWSFG